VTTRRIIPLTPRPPPRPPTAGPNAPARGPSPPLSVYVHFPWCVKKCPYCDFNSHAPREGGIPEQAWLDAVLADLQHALPQVWGRRVHSVFIGGGTPSLMSATTLDGLLTGIRMLLPLDPLAEITLEANPGTVEAGRFRDYRAAGVNRLSLGIQSFDDAMLARIGRIHGGEEARRAIEAARTHFERVNLDLMYALPGQTLDDGEADLETAIGFGVQHLSCYHLTLEPNTALRPQPAALPDDDTAADMQDPSRPASPPPASRTTRPPPSPARTSRAGTTSTTGPSATTSASAPAPTASSPAHEGIRREMRHKHPGRYLEGAARGDFIQEAREVVGGRAALRVHDERAAPHRGRVRPSCSRRARGCRSRPSPTNWRGRANAGCWTRRTENCGRRCRVGAS
jgi:hypothetical protein